MYPSKSPSNVPRLPSFLEMLENHHVLLTFDKVHNSLRRPRETTSERPKVLRTRQFFALLTWKCASRHNIVTFSTSELPKVLRSWCAWYILTWKCASRHNGVHCFDISTSKSGPTLLYILTWKGASRRNGVHFLIFHLAAWLRTRRFSEPTFRPSVTFLPFRAPASSFFSLFLFSDLLSSALLFSDSSHLCFSICPYCRKFDF